TPEAADGQHRKAVVLVHNPAWKPPECKGLPFPRLHPSEHLSRHPQPGGHPRYHFPGPWTCGDDQLLAGELAFARVDCDRASIAFPIEDLGLRENGRSTANGLFR